MVEYSKLWNDNCNSDKPSLEDKDKISAKIDLLSDMHPVSQVSDLQEQDLLFEVHSHELVERIRDMYRCAYDIWHKLGPWKFEESEEETRLREETQFKSLTKYRKGWYCGEFKRHSNIR